jgi:integrase
MVAAGQNPVQARQAEKAKQAQAKLLATAGEFEAVMKSWRSVTDAGLAPNTLRQRTNEIRKYLSSFFGRNIAGIRRAEITQFLKTVEETAPESARNLRTHLFYIFDHAIDTGLAEANPVPSPRALKRRRRKSLAFMDLAEVPHFLLRVNQSQTAPETKAAMWLVILTACRKNEVARVRWDELDLDAGLWTIPAARMKARREHVVPLSPQVVAIFRELAKFASSEYVLPHRDRPNAPMVERTFNATMERFARNNETVHGFRSTFSTYYNGKGVNPDVIERCLAHAPADKVRAAYNRHDYMAERRAVLEDWSDVIFGMFAQLVAKTQQHKIAA